MSIALAAMAGLFVGAQPANVQEAAEEGAIAALPQGVPSAEQAPIALMMDMTTGQVLFQRNIDRRFIPASITKVMTAYVAFEMLDAGDLTTDQTFPVSEEAFREWSGTGSSMNVARGLEVLVDDLLRGITSVSANDGSIVLAEGAAGSVESWIAKMNETARELGMADSHFGTPNGWPDDGETFVSARDLTKLARALIARHPDKYARYFGQRSFTYNGQTQENYDPISGIVPGGDGLKTGFTNHAGYGFLGSAERNGRRLVMLVGGAPDLDTRQSVSRDFIEWGFSGFDMRPLFEPGANVGRARVKGGNAAYVGLTTRLPIGLAQLPDKSNMVELQIRYNGPVKAPIATGDQVAALRMTVDGEVGSDIPLYAAEGVAKGGALDRLRDGLYTLIP